MLTSNRTWQTVGALLEPIVPAIRLTSLLAVFRREDQPLR